MLLVIAALLVVGLVGFLFFSPCGVTIEKFQDVPAVSVPEVAQGGAQAIPQALQQPPRELTGPERAAAVFGQYQPPPMQVKGFKDPSPAPPKPFAQPQPDPIPSFCEKYGYPSADNSIRLYSENECVSSFRGTWYENGECIFNGGRSLSYECRGLNNLQPAPQRVPQPGAIAIKSMMPPQPIAAPTPIAPTPASSEAALTLSPVQCSALCPVTQETCESRFSCQTRLEPIGVTPMSRTSTPAQINTTV